MVYFCVLDVLCSCLSACCSCVPLCVVCANFCVCFGGRRVCLSACCVLFVVAILVRVCGTQMFGLCGVLNLVLSDRVQVPQIPMSHYELRSSHMLLDCY